MSKSRLANDYKVNQKTSSTISSGTEKTPLSLGKRRTFKFVY